jgi:hypothetical protein
MASALSTSNGCTWSLGKSSKFPAKLYDWGKYTATWSVNPYPSKLSLVMNPIALALPSLDSVTSTGLSKLFFSPTKAPIRSLIDV